MVFAARITVTGRVQGVGFRDFTIREAGRRGLTGYVTNLPDGSVEAIAEGSEIQVRQFISALKKGPLLARVKAVEIAERPPTGGFPVFEVR
jgi:acylphosphatase